MVHIASLPGETLLLNLAFQQHLSVLKVRGVEQLLCLSVLLSMTLCYVAEEELAHGKGNLNIGCNQWHALCTCLGLSI